MHKAAIAAIVWFTTALAVSPAFAAGKVVAASDEWPLSDYGYQMAPDAERFALNLADFFTGGGRPGRFLVYSTNQGLTGDRLAATMRAAGHTWIVKSPIAVPNEDLSQYDAVFVGQNSFVADRLTDYVNAGGNVYVISGTGYGVADTQWNSFLKTFGLRFASRYNSVSGVTPIQSSHPLFAGVRSLLVIIGNSVEVDPTYSGGAIVATAGSNGLFGTFTAITLPMAIRSALCDDDVSLRRDSSGTLNVTVYGSDEAASSSIDDSSLRLLDVQANGGLLTGLLNAVQPLLCLDVLDGFAGDQQAFDAGNVAGSIWRDRGSSIVDGQVVLLTLSGRLKAQQGGTAIRAHDTVTLRTRATTTTTLTSNANPSLFGNPTFTAVVSSSAGVPPGSVTFSVDGGAGTTVPLSGSGQASLSVSALASGTHSVVATYTGAPGFVASTSSLSQSVPALACSAPMSIDAKFNGTSIPGGSYIWFNANLTAKGIPAAGATLIFENSTISFTADRLYTLPVPNAQIVFSPSAACATTTYDAASQSWKTTVPLAGSDEIFLSGVAFPVPASFALVLGKVTGPVTWTGTLATNTPGVSTTWKWSAAVYSQLGAGLNALGVKPAHTNTCSYQNSDHAGTPESLKSFVIGGAMGGGGANFTGGWSGTQSVKPTCQ
jgi:hypothetical protein